MIIGGVFLNYKILILAFSTLTVGLVELIVGGILPIIATDLNVSIGSAGQLITIFALVYAISGPVLLSITAKVERKRLFLFTLFIFFIGNMMTYFGSTYSFIMIARIVTAMSASLVVVLSLTMAPRLVEPAQRGRALGFVYMGVSSSLVLGVPVGIVLTNLFGWRTVFLGIAMFTIITAILVYFFLDRIYTGAVHPLSVQIKALGNVKIVGAHLATMFMLAGHYTVYAYFTPFLETTLQLNQYWISIFYFIFGISAVSGGAIGGALTEKIGTAKSILFVISTFAIMLFILPYATFSIFIFIIVMMVWGAFSWALSPPQQLYVIETDPDMSDIHQSLNNSAIQLGIAVGSGIGGTVLNYTHSVVSTAHVGSAVVVVAFLCALFSLTRPVQISDKEALR